MTAAAASALCRKHGILNPDQVLVACLRDFRSTGAATRYLRREQRRAVLPDADAEKFLRGLYSDRSLVLPSELGTTRQQL